MTRVGHIAVDLGAETGRVVLGEVRSGELWMREVHRFGHRPLPTPSGLCWDLTGLWREVLEGLRQAAALAESERISSLSVGVDSWGVDWAVISAGGTVVGLPRCYRDAAFAEACAAARRGWGAAGDRALFEATGIQMMPINTVFQVLAQMKQDPGRLQSGVGGGGQLVFMPDLFHWLLTGRRTVERTIASTSQMLNCRTGTWAMALLRQLGIPESLLAGEMIEPGAVVGEVTAEVRAVTGLPEKTRVIAPPGHDTAAAVAAVPADGASGWAYLSSGTWSLLGAELADPCVTDAAFEANFTNELGIAGTVRFLKNISGLWLVQQCRKCFARGDRDYDYAELTALAESAEPMRTLIDAGDGRFFSPRDMVEAIAEFARQTGQPVPQTPGEYVRCCLESLALEYGRTLKTLARLTGRTFDVVHLVGGGSKNKLLNQFAANAVAVRVCAGPVEATAIGNLLTQAKGMGLIKDLDQLRAIVRRTFAVEIYEPQSRQLWHMAAERYDRLRELEAAHAK